MEMERLAFERERFQFESTKALEQLRLEEMVQLEQIGVRKMEAHSRVVQQQLEYQKALVELAMKDEQHRMKILADVQKSEANINADKFLEGLRISDRAQDRVIKEREMLLKEKTGTGI